MDGLIYQLKMLMVPLHLLMEDLTTLAYYKFLQQHGTPEKRGELVDKCVMNDPRHGECWQAIAKEPSNAKKSVEEMLHLVAASLVN